MINNFTANESTLVYHGYSPVTGAQTLTTILTNQYNVQSPSTHIANHVFYGLTKGTYTDLYCLPIEHAHRLDPVYTDVGVMGW